MQVLEDVFEYEITADGTRETHLEQMLLNGNNIVLLVGWPTFHQCVYCLQSTYGP